MPRAAPPQPAADVGPAACPWGPGGGEEASRSIDEFCRSLKLQVSVLRRSLDVHQIPTTVSKSVISRLLEAISAAGHDLCQAAADTPLSGPVSRSLSLQESVAFLNDGHPSVLPRQTSPVVLMTNGTLSDAASQKQVSYLLAEQHAELLRRLDAEASWREELMRQLVLDSGSRAGSGALLAEKHAELLERLDVEANKREELIKELVVQGASNGVISSSNLVGGDNPDSSRNAGQVAKVATKMAKNLVSVEEEERIRMKAARVEHIKVQDVRASQKAIGDGEGVPDWRRKLRSAVQHPAFELLFCVAILANSAWIGYDVEHRAVHGDADAVYFAVVDYMFTGVFMLELAVRTGAEGIRFFYWGPNIVWNCLDTAIVAVSVMEVILEIVATMEDGGWTSNLRVLRIVRVMKLLRVIRVARIVRFVRSLRTLVYSIACTMRSLFWASVLLMLIMYVFGIVFTGAATEGITEEVRQAMASEDLAMLDRYWSSVGTSMFTLFKAISSGVTWDEVLRPLALIHWFWPFLFTIFIGFSLFAVLNVMTGVFCQSAIESAAHDQELLIQSQLQNKEQYISRAKSLFKEIDKDESGIITMQELEQRLSEPDVRNWLHSLEIDAEDAWTLFKLLDTDLSNIIEIEEFVIGCLRLKGTARSIDMQRLLYEQRGLIKRVSALISEHLSAMEGEDVEHARSRRSPSFAHAASRSQSGQLTFQACSSDP